MTQQTKRKAGRPAGRSAMTEAERDVIRLGVSSGRTIKQIAAFLGRGEATVENHLRRMRRDGSIGQGLLRLQVAGMEDE